MADVAAVFKRANVFLSEIVQDPTLPICPATRATLDVPNYAPTPAKTLWKIIFALAVIVPTLLIRLS